MIAAPHRPVGGQLLGGCGLERPLGLRDGVVEVRQKSKQMALVLEAVALTERDVPDYIEVDHKAMKGKFVRTPKLADVPFPVQM